LQEMDARAKAAQLQQGIAKSEQELGLAGMGALQQAGATQQAYEQAKLDAPLKIATQVGNLMAGKQIPITDTSKFIGPKAGAYQLSDLATMLGVMSTLGAIRPGSPGANVLGSIGGGLASAFRGALPTSYTIDPTEFTGGSNQAGTPLYFDRETYSYYDPSGNPVDVEWGI
jgi:hypothetical protein